MMPLGNLIRSGFTKRQAAAMVGLAKLEVLGPIRLNFDDPFPESFTDGLVVGEADSRDAILMSWEYTVTPWAAGTDQEPTTPGGSDYLGADGFLYGAPLLSHRRFFVSANDVTLPGNTALGAAEFYPSSSGAISPSVVQFGGPLRLWSSTNSESYPESYPQYYTAGASDFFILIARGS